MYLDELLDTVQYITDKEGNRQAVLLDLDLWQTLLQHLDLNGERQVDSERQTAIMREEAAYRKMYKALYEKYAGEHVAIYQEKLVDHDADSVALYKRIRREYPGEFVLITPVGPEVEETYQILSPRLIVEK